MSNPAAQRPPKWTSKWTSKCSIFLKKPKMRFDCYLLHIGPFLTSKNDFKIDQKSSKNRSGHKHLILHAFFCIFSHQNQNLTKKGPKRGPKTGVPKWCKNPPGGPLDHMLTQDGPQKLQHGPADPKMIPKLPQNDSKMTPK